MNKITHNITNNVTHNSHRTRNNSNSNNNSNNGKGDKSTKVKSSLLSMISSILTSSSLLSPLLSLLSYLVTIPSSSSSSSSLSSIETPSWLTIASLVHVIISTISTILPFMASSSIQSSSIQSSISSLSSSKMSSPRGDNRLYCDELLYGEGRHKPTLRGYSHLLVALLMPFVIYRLYQQGSGSIYTMFVATIFSLTNVLIFVCSALFHVGQWSHSMEIVLQKLDHMACSLFAAGKMIPLAMLAFPFPMGMLLLTMIIITCIWNFWGTFTSNPSVLRQAFIPACLFPFIYPYCTSTMTSFEFSSMVLILVFQGIGAMIFAFEYPNPFPKHFGYHEIFHFFVIIAGGFSIIANGSIIERASLGEL